MAALNGLPMILSNDSVPSRFKESATNALSTCTSLSSLIWSAIEGWLVSLFSKVDCKPLALLEVPS